MRFTIFLIVSLFYLQAIGQQKPWNKIGIDSNTFCKVYGSEFEYQFQNEQMYKSSHKHLVVLVGSKSYWANEVSMYLQDRWNYDEENSKEGADFSKFVFTAKIYTTKVAPKITMMAYLNKKDRIAKVTISGKADDIIDLFVKYWEFSKLSFNDLKKNKTIYQVFGSDKVTFSWTGIDPIITITRSENPLIIPQL